MPNDRDDLLEAFRDAREDISGMGLRRAYLYRRLRTWYTGAAAPLTAATNIGDGYPVDTLTEITPPPLCDDSASYTRSREGGEHDAGTIKVRKITPKSEAGNFGVEFSFLERAARWDNEELHWIICWRGGTAWHHWEGSKLFTTPGPTSVATAITAVNALKSAVTAHWALVTSGSNYSAHLAADGQSLTSPDATDEASAITLANEIRTKWANHRTNVSAHVEADPYPLTAAAATNALTLLVLLHDLIATFNRHIVPGDVNVCARTSNVQRAAWHFEMSVVPTREVW